MGIRTTFSENLRRLRAEKGMSQEALAHSAGLDRTYISSIEREVYAASLDVVERLAQSLNVRPDELLQSNSVQQTWKRLKAK